MKKRVLIVEDETNARMAMAEFLAMAGFEVYSAEDAVQALEVGQGCRPDVLLCDYLLPGTMNGVEVARRLHEALPDLKVFIMSGLSRSDCDAALGALPLSGFLSKPLSLWKVREHINEVCG